MTPEEARKQFDGMCDMLVGKGTLLLTVTVPDKEAVEELFSWMYDEKRPTRFRLESLAWDQAVVPQKVAEAVRVIQEA